VKGTAEILFMISDQSICIGNIFHLFFLAVLSGDIEMVLLLLVKIVKNIYNTCGIRCKRSKCST